MFTRIGGPSTALMQIVPLTVVAILFTCAGCVTTGRVDDAGADLIDLVARQTAAAFDEYESDLQIADADRRQAVIQALAERIKRDGIEQTDHHAAAALDALDRIAADRLVARQRYEAAIDNVELLYEVAGGFRRRAQRLADLNLRLRSLFPQPAPPQTP